ILSQRVLPSRDAPAPTRRGFLFVRAETAAIRPEACPLYRLQLPPRTQTWQLRPGTEGTKERGRRAPPLLVRPSSFRLPCGFLNVHRRVFRRIELDALQRRAELLAISLHLRAFLFGEDLRDGRDDLAVRDAVLVLGLGQLQARDDP